MLADYGYRADIIQPLKNGVILGKRDQEAKTLSWNAVPYAQPPVGDLRWKAPRTLGNWDGVLETRDFGNKSLQINGLNIIGSEDCLYLNIWRPDSEEENLPVLVWAHGGGNILGSGEDFPGDILARKTNCIIISLNYRLGILGWFRFPALQTGDKKDDSGNYGLLDIIKALEWVRENIQSFGGNQDNVTLGGHSAGARNALVALISPLARGLFKKALIVSGGRTLAQARQGEDFAREIIVKMLLKDGIAQNRIEVEKWLDRQPAERIQSLLRGKRPEEFLPFLGAVEIRMSDFPHLFRDGYVIPEEGFQLTETGEYSKVPIILGSDATEYGIYNVLDGYWGSTVTDLSILKDKQRLRLYLLTLEYGSKLFAWFNADSTADLLSQVKDQPPVFVYRLGWGTRQGTLNEDLRKLVGASHQVDLDFFTGHENYILNTIFPGMCYTPDNQPGRKALTDLIMGYTGNFIHTGDPNHNGLERWLPWNNKEDRKWLMKLDADATRAFAYMTEEYLKKEEILDEIQSKLNQQEQELIIGKLLQGRFFMEY